MIVIGEPKSRTAIHALERAMAKYVNHGRAEVVEATVSLKRRVLSPKTFDKDMAPAVCASGDERCSYVERRY